jgi:hypothetical protein
MDPKRADTTVSEDPAARLERAFIAEFLEARGYDATGCRRCPRHRFMSC